MAETTAAASAPADGSKTCPSCGATLTWRAKRCRLCYTWLGGEPVPPRVVKQALIATDFIAADAQNRRNTTLLIVIVLALGVGVGWLVGLMVEAAATGLAPAFGSPSGVFGAGLFLSVGLISVLVTLLSGRRAILGLTGAATVTAEQEPVLHNVAEEMAIAAGLPLPQLAVIESPALNAFATGMRSDRAAIAVTRGLLQGLSRDELQGVVAHEMAHIRNLDIRYATAVAILVGLIALFADFGVRLMRVMPARSSSSSRKDNGGAALFIVIGVVCLMLAPFFAMMVQFAVSRQREFLADATSVRLTRNPTGLISALEKLHASTIELEASNRAVQHMFIVNPLRDFSEWSSNLIATHPPIERRIERLRNLGGSGEVPAEPPADAPPVPGATATASTRWNTQA